MYAINGNSFRAIINESDLMDGEILSLEYPYDISKPDPISQTKKLITEWLDFASQAKGYDGIVSCVSYANSTNEKFKEEALAAIAWRDAVYSMGYEILANTPDGIETPEQVIEILPKPEDYGF